VAPTHRKLGLSASALGIIEALMSGSGRIRRKSTGASEVERSVDADAAAASLIELVEHGLHRIASHRIAATGVSAPARMGERGGVRLQRLASFARGSAK
jgi:hypothetical protein